MRVSRWCSVKPQGVWFRTHGLFRDIICQWMALEIEGLVREMEIIPWPVCLLCYHDEDGHKTATLFKYKSIISIARSS